MIMANSSNTPARSVRIDDELWHAAQEQAKKDGVTVTSVIVNGLYEYLKEARLASGDVVE